MDTPTLSQEIFNTILLYYNAYFEGLYGTLMASYANLFRVILCLYAIYKGYELWLNKDHPWYDLLKTFASVTILYVIVLETNIYSEYITKPFVTLVNDLSIFFARGESSQIFTALDKQALKFIDATQQVWPSSWNPMDHIFAFFAQLVLYFAFFSMFFAFLVIYCISYFSMNIFFLFGGIFILFGTIKETRSLFFAWLRNLCQFALTIIIASITLGLSFNGIVKSIDKLENLDISNIFTFDYLSLIAWCAITIALFLKSADFAAGLTMTLAGSTAGIAGAISAGGGMAAAGAASSTLLGGKASYGAAKWLDQKTGGHVGGAIGNAYERLKAIRGTSE